jgi:hypothetical protein
MESIKYLIWKKDNSLIITTDLDEILNINKDDIKVITKENLNNRTYISELYFNKDNKDNKPPDTIIEKYNLLYLEKMNEIEPYHLTEKDLKIIRTFNSS